MGLLAQNPLFWLGLVVVVVVVYSVPTVVAAVRGVRDLGTVVAVNFMFGATGVGWGAALVLAFLMPTREESAPPRSAAVDYMPGQPPPPDDAHLAEIARAGGNPADHW